jgi:Leucine-rich repeat (LRR) protein
VYLSLEGCENLKELPKSIGKLQRLVFLHLSSCSRLKKLPTSLAKLLMLENLDLRSCEKLEYLPVEMSNLKALQSLQFVSATNCNGQNHNPSTQIGFLMVTYYWSWWLLNNSKLMVL